MRPTKPTNHHRISQYETPWTIILESGDESVSDAHRYILEYYGDCAFQYLKNLTRDDDLANELVQEFAVRFITGKYRNANPDRGRFRDYLKIILRNLFYEHCRNEQKFKRAELSDAHFDVATADNDSRQFDEHWRQVILSRTWDRLQQYSNSKSNVYFWLLRIRAEFPEFGSQELADKTSSQIGEPVNADWVRQNLKRSRDKFREFLLDEVRKTLGGGDEDLVRDELADLRLLSYVN